MSGDVQPRKRKDKKKRKDDVDQISEKPHVSVFSNNTLNNEDVNIHVHKDEGTGGGICAKLVFFILFSALAVLIGLIITEHRGLTDLETIDPNSKFSQIFEGWVDSNSHDEHDEHDLNAIDDPDDDHHEYDSDHADEDDNDDRDDNDEKSIEAEHSEEQDDDDGEELEPIEDDDEGTDEEPEDEDSDEDNINEIYDEHEDYNDDDNDTVEGSKESGEFAASEEDDVEQDKEEDDENGKNYGQKDTEDYDDDNDKEVDGDQDMEEQDEDAEAEVSNEKRDDEDEQLDDEDDNSKGEDEDDDQDIGDDDQENEQDEDITTNKEVSDENDEEKDDAHEDTLSNNKEVIKEEKIQLESKGGETNTKDAEKAEDDDSGSSGMAVKLGVGVALLVVAHLVLVKKWRNADHDTLPSAENPPPTVQDRRNTIIVPPTFKEVESDMEQYVEDFADEDEENEGEENAGVKSKSNSAKAKYQELATAYTRPVLESKYDTEHTQGDYEYEDEEEEQYQEEVEDEEEEVEEEESEDEEGEGEEYDDEEEDVDDEDAELLKRLEARYGKLQKDNENRDYDFDKHTEDNEYEYTNIASEDDYRIRKQIEEAGSSVKNNSTHAIVLFDKLLQKFPSSPRSLYGKAMALDILAEQKRSNELLEKSLQIYVQVLQTENVPAALYQLAADRCINRMRFIGQYKNAIAVHKLIIKRFPDNPQHLNSLVVTYLTINRIEDARIVLKEILTKWPEDGFALVHYGFILKTTDNKLEESVRYLNKGISTKDKGVIDGRFYFHLGDALARLGRRVEADKIYEEGRRNKVFLSKYQRSLYNVPRLSAKPWWSFKDLPSYSKSLSLLAASWKQIRDEGLNILNEKGYFQDESENLRHTGEWKQFELFARGQKNIKNCKICPITCNIINQIPEANTCRRGQTKFSVMHPRTHIWPHCGPTNCRLRAHLGLKIPTNTFIRVADNTKGWKEGELLIFDDSFEHEVWHNGTDFRLILIVDIWHPELTAAERNNLSPI